MDSIAERVKALIAAAPSQARLAKAGGVSEGSLINWSRGLGLRDTKIDGFARKLGVSPTWLRLGEGEAQDAIEAVHLKFESDHKAADNAHESGGGGPRARIRRAREARRLTLAQLSKLTRLPVGYLDALESGSAPGSERALKAICREMPELSLEELMSGSEALPVESDDAVEASYGAEPKMNFAAGVKGRNVPVLSYAEAGPWDAGHSDSYYEHQAVFAPNVDDRRAFALKISGNSMEPQLFDGDYVVCSPAAKLVNGEAAVVRTRGEEVYVKFYVQEGERVSLISANSDYDPIKMPLSAIRGAWKVVRHISSRELKIQLPEMTPAVKKKG
jgi:SOS-response transcriptional repressor LexA